MSFCTGKSELDTQLNTPMSSSEDLIKKLAYTIRLLVVDVDGVMTDGGLYYDDNGLCMKRFNVLDGIGFLLAKEAGIGIAILTGMNTPSVEKRLKDLGITDYLYGVNNKYRALDALRTQKGLQWNEIAYIGDDWVDLASMTCVGLPIAVANAALEIKNIAKYITQKQGGDGAVREVINLLIHYQGKKEALLEAWTNLK